MWGEILPHIREFAGFLQESFLSGRAQKRPHLYAA